MTTRVRLRPGRERAVRNGHPWIYSGALAGAPSDPTAAWVDVEDDEGRFLVRGFYSARSQIRVRVVARQPIAIDRRLFAGRLEVAQALRARLVPAGTDGYRVINAEGDRLPGWTVDRFGDVLVSQMTCAGLDASSEEAYAALAEAFPTASILHLGDLAARRGEGLSLDKRWIRGEPRTEVEFEECGLRFVAELGAGQKTGFYCDQRDNRRRAEALAGDAAVLDLFAHTGAYSLYALRGGARQVVLVDSAARLLATAARQIAANGFDDSKAELVTGDVFEHLRHERRRFDLVICDPPPLARRAADVERAARAYKDLNRLALGRVAPGGFLFTFSCSGAVDAKLFRQVLFAAAVEAGVELQLLAPLAAAGDHPVSAFHPEGEYLKGWLARVVDAV